MSGREQFLAALGACEQTSAALLLALNSGSDDPGSLAAHRREEIEMLAKTLPEDLRAGDLERLTIILNRGQEAWLRALTEKLSATRALSSLQRALQVTRQLAATRTSKQPAVDCTG